MLSPAQKRYAVWRARIRISNHIQQRLSSQTGAFAAAVLTDDRTGLNALTVQILRHSNLAHLLAISGLHMGLFTGFVFALLRLALICLPEPIRYGPTKQIAACGAILAGATYLALSGGNVATERVFIMALVAFAALLFEKRVLSVRSFAAAEFIVLVLRPEALLEPGFQMSFAAILALVTVFSVWQAREMKFGPRWIQPVWILCLSSMVTRLATGPIAAAHFNIAAQYGLVANLVYVPLIGLLLCRLALLLCC